MTGVRDLRHEIEAAHLVSRRCARVLPDVVSRYIQIGGSTATVHGACEPGFQRVWNHLLPISSELPHGGYKQSGYGKDMSIYSMEEYTQLKHVAIKIG